MLPGGENSVYVVIGSDAEEFANGLKDVSKQAEVASASLDALIVKAKELITAGTQNYSVPSVLKQMFPDADWQSIDAAVFKARDELGALHDSAVTAGKDMGNMVSPEEFQQMTQSIDDTGTAFEQTGAKKDVFKVNVGGLGDMMRYVRLSAFLIFMTALNDIKQVFADSITAANAYSIAIFGLDVAVRAYQRDGFDVSLQQVHDKIAEIQKLYPYFNVTDMDTAMTKLINSTREFGVTSEQAFQLYGDAAKIATMQGITMEEAVNKIMTAVTSGAHAQQALRTMGIAVNSDLELAYAKYNAIVDDTTNKLTLEQKAAAALGLIHEFLAKTSDDVNSAQDVLGNRTKAVTTDWQNFLAVLGKDTLPVLLNIKEGLLGLLSGLQIVDYEIMKWGGRVIDAFKIVGDAYDEFAKHGTIDSDAIKKDWEDLIAASDEWANYTAFQLGKDPLADAAIGTSKPPDTSNTTTAMADAKTKIEKIQEDLTTNLANLWKSYYEDLDKITLDGERKRADDVTAYDQQMEKLSVTLMDNLAKEDRSAQESSLAEEVKYEQSVADAKEKNQEQVLAAEKTYQEKIAQLRFDLENNLEDALATRDARQITRLIRTEQDAEQSAKTQYDNEKKARDTTFTQELNDLKAQEDQRQLALEVSHQDRMKEIEIQNKQEQDAALVDLQNKESALDTNLAQQRADRLTKFNQDKIDLLNATGKLVADLTTSLTDQYNLTATDLAQLYSLYDSYYGPNGSLLTMMYNFYAAIGSIGTGGGSGGGTPKMAEGGAFIANRATNVTFGEAGPEAAFFMPLNGSQMGNLGSFGSNISGGGSGGKSVVEIWLSPDLESRIVNKSQTGIINVITKELS